MIIVTFEYLVIFRGKFINFIIWLRTGIIIFLIEMDATFIVVQVVQVIIAIINIDLKEYPLHHRENILVLWLQIDSD